VRGVIGRIDRHGLPSLDQRQLLESKIPVDAAEPCAATGVVGVEQQPRSVDGAVVVQANRLLDVGERFNGAVDGLLLDGVEIPRRRILRVERLR